VFFSLLVVLVMWSLLARSTLLSTTALSCPRRDLCLGYGAVITSGQPYYVSTGTTASTVQDRCPGLPVSKRPGTVVLGRWLSTRLWRPSASTPFVWLCDVLRPTYTDHLRRSVFCRCWPTSV